MSAKRAPPEPSGAGSAEAGFFAELQRHRVYKVGALYAVIGWGIVQASDIALEAFEAPSWVLKSILIAIVTGFPIALLLARVFHPDEAERARPARRAWLLKWAAAVLLLSTLAVSLFVARRMVSNAPPRVAAPADLGKAIAVLPVSYTGPPEGAAFADGMHEDVLTRLASVSALHVLSRDLVLTLEGTSKDSKTIGDELGAGYVLWNSLRLDGSTLRLNSRLVDAEQGTHLWAKTFDRKLTDLFQLQAELAQEIAVALQAVISPAERAQLARPLSASVEAYEAYAQGQAASTGTERERWFERAVELDPSFARAWAALAGQRAQAYQVNASRRPEQRQRASQALERALSLDAEDLQVRMAAAWFYGQTYRDWPRAHHELARIAQQQPNSAEVAFYLARAATRKGNPADALEPLRRAWQLEPVSSAKAEWLARTYRGLRRFDAALAVYAELSAQGRLRFPIALEKALLDFRMARDSGPVLRFMEQQPPLSELPLESRARLREAAWELGDLPLFLRHARALEQPADGDDAPLQQTFLALALRQSGDTSASHESFVRTQTELRRRVNEEPENATLWAVLGLNLAASGSDRREALAAVGRAIQLVPLTADAADAPHLRAAYACALAWLGQRAEAVAELERLLGSYYEETWGFYLPIYVEHLRRGIEWLPLRDFPPFAALLANPRYSAPL